MTSRFVARLKDVTIIPKKKKKDEANKPASDKIGTVTPKYPYQEDISG